MPEQGKCFSVIMPELYSNHPACSETLGYINFIFNSDLEQIKDLNLREVKPDVGGAIFNLSSIKSSDSDTIRNIFYDLNHYQHRQMKDPLPFIGIIYQEKDIEGLVIGRNDILEDGLGEIIREKHPILIQKSGNPMGDVGFSLSQIKFSFEDGENVEKLFGEIREYFELYVITLAQALQNKPSQLKMRDAGFYISYMLPYFKEGSKEMLSKNRFVGHLITDFESSVQK